MKPFTKRYSRYVWGAVLIGGPVAVIATVRWRTVIGPILNDASPTLVALATIAIAYFTFTLWRTTKDTLGHLEHEFISNHRPKLIVRSVLIESDLRAAGEPNHHTLRRVIRYHVVNIGATAATIVQSSTTRWFVPTPKALTPGDPLYGSDLSLPNTLVSGEEWVGVCDADRLQESFAYAYHHSELPLYFLGHIVYEDDLKVRRRTGFLRRLAPQADGFIREDNLDFEYSD